MKKYVCNVCGYIYDPEENNGVAFEDLPDDYLVADRSAQSNDVIGVIDVVVIT